MQHISAGQWRYISRQKPNCKTDIGFKVLVAIDLSVRSYRQGKMYYFAAEQEKVVENP
jgi:hypothetical protein